MNSKQFWFSAFIAVTLCSCGASKSSSGPEGDSDTNVCTLSKLKVQTANLSPIYQGSSTQLAGVTGDTAILINVLAPEIIGVTPDGNSHFILNRTDAMAFNRTASTIFVNAKASSKAAAWSVGGELFAFDRNTLSMHLLVPAADSFSIGQLAIDSQYVYFHATQNDESAHLWRIPLVGGTPEIIIDDFETWSWYMGENGHFFVNGKALLEYNSDGSKIGAVKPGFTVSDSKTHASSIAYRSSYGSLYTASIYSPTNATKTLSFGDDVYGFISDGTALFGDHSFKLVHADPAKDICTEYTDIQASQMIPRNGNLWFSSGYSLYILKY